MPANIKRVTKNTFLLYIRMFLSMIVGLYTSRIVLDTLGVENFGIYGIVGSITIAMSFINSTLSGATSRFVSYEIGTGDRLKLSETMSTSILIHFFLSVLILILGETIGLWFLNNKLVIPPNRLFAAQIVYQLSLLGAIIGIIRTPYDADIIANEKMDAYAYFEIAHVVMKLLIVYILVIGDYDKLILYAILMQCVAIIFFFIYKIYCNRHFDESKFQFVWNKSLLRRQLSFSGYNIFGNVGSVINAQASNFLINIFFGVFYNAAVGIASTVSNTINSFVSNINTAFRPAIIKEYSAKDYKSVHDYINLAIIASIFLLAIIGVPIMLNIDYVLSLWLKIVPPDSGKFATLIFVDIIFVNTRYVLTMGIHAVGRVKENSIINGTLYLLNPIIIYCLFKFGYPVYFAYISLIVVDVIMCVSSFVILQRLIPQMIHRVIAISFVKCLLIALLSTSIIKLLVFPYFNQQILQFVSSIGINAVLISAFYFLIVLSSNQKQYLINKIVSKLKFVCEK